MYNSFDTILIELRGAQRGVLRYLESVRREIANRDSRENGTDQRIEEAQRHGLNALHSLVHAEAIITRQEEATNERT